jgi:hypothetical protein
MPARRALVLISLALAFFTSWALSSLGTLSRTPDELLHFLGAYHVRFHSDYRINREDPPLFLHFAGLFLDESDIPTPLTAEQFAASRHGADAQLAYFAAVRADPRTRLENALWRARLAALLVALALGITLSAAAWKLGGPLCGVTAAFLFALEPLFLGHSVILKNDLAITLVYLLFALALHETCGKSQSRAVPVLALLAVTALGPVTKFSGLFLPLVILPLGLLVRSLIPTTWHLGPRTLHTRPQKLVAALTLWAAAVMLSYLTLWLAYGLRQSPTPDPQIHFDLTQFLLDKSHFQSLAEGKTYTPSSGLAPPTWTHFFPESFSAGLLYTYTHSILRPAFLLGHYSDTGFYAYFPLAYLFKTPLTTITLLLIASVYAVSRPHMARRYFFLLLPAACYLLIAIQSRLNLGLRHLSPVYPALILSIALTLPHLLQKRPKLLLVPLFLLLLEVVPCRAQYIQFFNLPSRLLGRDGLALLSDSNLDWAQDLNRLKAWQKQHPTEQLFTLHFGEQPPPSAGIRARNAFNFNFALTPQPPDSPLSGLPSLPPGSILAISATHLQGTYLSDSLRSAISPWRDQTPIATLGSTLYLYRVPSLPPQTQPPGNSPGASSVRH